MENGKKENLKELIGKYNLQNTRYIVSQSYANSDSWIEWLYFTHGDYYCITNEFNEKDDNHTYVFSRIDKDGKEYFIYDGSNREELIKLLEKELKK